MIDSESWSRCGPVGVSLLTKRPVHPLDLQRLELSLREQARSHRIGDRLGILVTLRTCGSELAHEEAGAFSRVLRRLKVSLREQARSHKTVILPGISGMSQNLWE